MGNVSNLTKRISLSKQQCMTQPALINLNPYEYIQGLCYYLCAVNLVRCSESYNTLDDQSSKICVPSKTKDVNLSVLIW